MEFIADSMLGKLAKWLRILGYDVIYKNDFTPEEILRISEETERIVLTRNTDLIKNKRLKKYVFIKSDFLFNQLKQVIEELKLELKEENFFTRCSVCNQKIQEIKKEEIKDKIPEYVYKTQEEFGICNICKRIYWKATHYERMLERMKEENIIERRKRWEAL
jgi:uncharacterized protein with PIN domain